MHSVSPVLCHVDFRGRYWKGNFTRLDFIWVTGFGPPIQSDFSIPDTMSDGKLLVNLVHVT